MKESEINVKCAYNMFVFLSPPPPTALAPLSWQGSMETCLYFH